MTALDELTTRPDSGPIRTGWSADPTIRQRWRRIRVLIGAGVVLVIGAIIVALGSGKAGKPLDPQSYTPSGTHALSVLLAQRGVHVLRETDAATAAEVAVPGMTLVVVTHDDRIFPFADRLLRLEDGAVTEEWAPSAPRTDDLRITMAANARAG